MGNLQRFDGASLAAAGALSIHVLAEYNPCLLQAWDGLPPKQALHCTHQSQHLAIQDEKKTSHSTRFCWCCRKRWSVLCPGLQFCCNHDWLRSCFTHAVIHWLPGVVLILVPGDGLLGKFCS